MRTLSILCTYARAWLVRFAASHARAQGVGIYEHFVYDQHGRGGVPVHERDYRT